MNTYYQVLVLSIDWLSGFPSYGTRYSTTNGYLVRYRDIIMSFISPLLRDAIPEMFISVTVPGGTWYPVTKYVPGTWYLVQYHTTIHLFYLIVACHFLQCGCFFCP